MEFLNMAKNVLYNNIDIDKDTIDITKDNTKLLGPGDQDPPRQDPNLPNPHSIVFLPCPVHV